MQRQEDQLRTGETIRLDSKLVEKWESGEVGPRLFYQSRLCLLLEVGDPGELDLVPSARLELEIQRLRTSLRRPGARVHPPGEAISRASIWYVPYERDSHFVDQEHLLDHVDRLLTDSEGVSGGQHVLCGLAGDNRHVALEYAYRHGGAYEAVLWMRMGSVQTMRADLVALSQRIDGLPSITTGQCLLSVLRRWLGNHAGWLLVLEDVKEQELLLDLLRAADDGHILVTTRTEFLEALTHTIQQLSGQDGLLLARKWGGPREGNAADSSASPYQRTSQPRIQLAAGAGSQSSPAARTNASGLCGTLHPFAVPEYLRGRNA